MVEKLGKFVHGGRRGLRLFGGEFVDCSEQSGVDGTCVEQKGAEDFENSSFVGSEEGWGRIGEASELYLAAAVVG